MGRLVPKQPAKPPAVPIPGFESDIHKIVDEFTLKVGFVHAAVELAPF